MSEEAGNLKTKLINAIIDAYNSTRIAHVTPADHVLGKHYVRDAFEKYDAEIKVSKENKPIRVNFEVNFEDTRKGPIGSEGHKLVVEMTAVPRVGDTVFFGSVTGFTVNSVLWTPYETEYDVIVRGW